MSGALPQRLADALGEGPLAARLAASGEPFLRTRADDEALRRLDGPVLLGLARVLASQPKAAGFLSHRPALVERIAAADSDTLAARGPEILAGGLGGDPDDLEARLDDLRLLRREETCLAACLDLGGALPFESVSEFLSLLAEGVTRRALALARTVGAGELPPFAVVGMGKIAGREFTYHSDLDLIFLYEGGPEVIDRSSRLGQRLIHYLGTMTGAGVAYPVDTRLRPSGQQGLLVTSTASFERYQTDRAQTWEHLALLRARAIAGEMDSAQRVLDRTRQQVVGEGFDGWPEIDDMRRRVAQERGDAADGGLPIKTGRGGLMDVDFLAAGAVLEGGAPCLQPVPSVEHMLRAAAPAGATTDALLADYGWLRRVEARCRWLRGRAVERLETEAEHLACVAELTEPGMDGEALLERTRAACSRVRAAYDAVVAAGSVRGLEPAAP